MLLYLATRFRDRDGIIEVVQERINGQCVREWETGTVYRSMRDAEVGLTARNTATPTE